ncbi:hypothetical protein ACIN5162_0795 [Acinetobacter baumannii OIFC0162]|uniref:Uncharacterized protein n=1 Tax=Acinetobacter ursingii ANC 3649 TaxID=1257043 RepID=N9BWX4_9GAMM|nr:hypothetical protein ACIN5162_0795 [Acinetobacter baumannii OIFC0162]ENV77816.1 hypothetical protein F942_03526 [Acinetobacter ursingii ANC 3649]
MTGVDQEKTSLIEINICSYYFELIEKNKIKILSTILMINPKSSL